MCRFPRAWCALTAMVWAVPGIQNAVAQETPSPGPEVLAQRCIHHVTTLANACIRQNLETVKVAVRKVEALVEQGEIDKARAVAARGIQAVNTQSRECGTAIQNSCARCVKALTEAGARPELIEALKTACRRQGERVERSRNAAVGAIKQALEGDGGGE